MVNTIKTLTLTFDSGQVTPLTVECQLTKAQLVDSPTTEELTTFCGTESSSIPNYALEIGGFQDYDGETALATATRVCDLLHLAYIATPVADIDFVLTVGGGTRTGVCRPTADVPFGGDAGAALTFETSLDVIGAIVDGATP